MANPEKLATGYTRLRTTQQRQSRETGNRVHKTKKNKTKTIQRNWQQGTQD
jgi:hypothetical protein